MKQKGQYDFTPQHDYIAEFDGSTKEGHKRLGRATHENRRSALQDAPEKPGNSDRVITKARS